MNICSVCRVERPTYGGFAKIGTFGFYQLCWDCWARRAQRGRESGGMLSVRDEDQVG